MKFLILFFIPALSFAQSVSVFRNAESRHLSLHSTSCEALIKEARAFAEWSRSLGQPAGRFQTYREEGHCYLDVHSVAPEVVRDRYGTFATENGPNCFNTALTASGVLPHLRHTSANELEFWLTSPLCQKVQRNQLRPGDIISIRDSDNNHVHSFNYISQNLSFTKDGYELSQNYTIRKTADVISSYHTPAFCKEGCTNEHYRCTPIEKYLKENPISDGELKQQWDILNEIECQSSEIAMGVLPINTLAMSVLESVEILSREKAEETEISEEVRLLWRAMQLKVSSLRQQYQFVEERHSRR